MNKQEIELIVKASQGDELAFNELYNIYYKQAYYFALKISNCDADAKDAAQETFIQIQASLKNLKEPSCFKQWMMQIVISKCNKIFRKNKYTVLDPVVVNAMEVEEERSYMSGKNNFDRLSRREMLFSMMNKLTYNQREILVLTYFEQLSIKEMAKILAIPEGTVKSRMMNAKASLKLQIQELEIKEKLYFRSIPLPLLLALSYKKSFLSLFKMNPKSTLMHSVVANPMVLVTSFVTLGVVGTGAYNVYQEQAMKEDQNISSQVIKEQDYTQKEIYYKLKEWAHCQVEMGEKSQTEIQQMKVLYDLLKLENGAYFHRLQLQDWNTAFEAL